MIIATPLDIPKLEPDNWTTFWDIWNTHADLLIKKYLNESIIFSRYTDVPDIFLEPSKTVPAPITTPVDGVEVKKESEGAKLQTTPTTPLKMSTI
jgi:hypothetical protein